MATVPPTADPAINVRKPAASGSRTRAVGNETKGDMAGAMGGARNNPSLVGDTGLKTAVSELYSQHPHDYNQHGPHHGTSDHVRHVPLHSMTPSPGKYSR